MTLNNNIDNHVFYKEQIVILYYNLTRKNNDTTELSMIFDNLLCSLKQHIHLELPKPTTKKTKTKKVNTAPYEKQNQYIQYLVLLYKMVGQTRDCVYGKGEHDLSYMMLTVFYKYYPVLAIFALHKFVQPLYNGEDIELGKHGELGHCGYGSWRDLKYFCEYLRCNTRESIHHPLIKYCVQMMNNTLKKDFDTWNDVLDNYFQQIIRSSSFSSIETIKKPVAREHLSCVCKWIPREYKKFDWLNEMLVIDWFETYKPYYLTSHKSVAGYYNSLSKCKLLYRKMVSKLNKVLDTTEIKLCSNQLDEIIPKNIPQIMFMKNKNKLWYNNIIDNTKIDFVTNNVKTMKQKCANDFHRHYEQKFFLLSPFEPNRKHSKIVPMDLPISLLIKEAYKLYVQGSVQGSVQGCQPIQLKIDILNHQWNQISSIIGTDTLNNFIPIIDISFDMDKLSDAFFASIGLAFLICCRSSLGKRIITIDHKPTWINLEHCSDLFSMISTFFGSIKSASNTNYNVIEAFDMIIDCITETKMSYRKIAKLSLVLFHQNNLSCNNSSTIFHTLITDLFYTKGLCSSRGKPFPTPRIVYWNISDSGCSQLPFTPFRISNATPTNDNVFVLSGLSSSLIRHLYLLDNVCPISPKNHHSNISYDLIYNILDNNRYDVLGNYLINLSM
jgi:hypothetical protein